MIVLMKEFMTQRFRAYCRQGGIYYLFDRITGQRQSLETSDQATALRLLHAHNESQQQPLLTARLPVPIGLT